MLQTGLFSATPAGDNGGVACTPMYSGAVERCEDRIRVWPAPQGFDCPELFNHQYFDGHDKIECGASLLEQCECDTTWCSAPGESLQRDLLEWAVDKAAEAYGERIPDDIHECIAAETRFGVDSVACDGGTPELSDVLADGRA